MRRRGGRLLAAPDRLRTGLTLAAVLLVAAGTQVIPTLPLPPVPVTAVAAALPSMPFEVRIEANLDRVAAEIAGAGPDEEQTYRKILDDDRQLLQFDPDANRGSGSWSELVGEIDEQTEAVGILVPGGHAFVTADNFSRYYRRASDLVEQSGGRLAMVIWAAGDFPRGWIQGAMSRYHAPLGRALALFSHELRMEIDNRLRPGAEVRVVAVGHSFGGAVVGSAERYGLDVDAVLHVASAGMGDVRDPYDYPEPDRPRYSMTAPGDLIGFVQGVPGPPGLGHGPDPDTFRCVTELPTGRLPVDPAATDELGRPLGDRAGDTVGGITSHSDVFIRYSDAWWGIYRVLLGVIAARSECPTPPDPEPVKVRALPLALPRIVTDSQCRSGGGLRPGGRHRLLSRTG